MPVGEVRSVHRQANTDKFGNRPYLEVIFNTTKNPHTRIGLNQEVFDMTRSTNMNPRWFLITITLKDYVDFRNYEHGIQVQAINDNLVYTDVIKNDSLKPNNSDFFITPNESSMREEHNLCTRTSLLQLRAVHQRHRGHLQPRRHQRKQRLQYRKANSIRVVNDDKYQRLDKNNFL